MNGCLRKRFVQAAVISITCIGLSSALLRAGERRVRSAFVTNLTDAEYIALLQGARQNGVHLSNDATSLFENDVILVFLGPDDSQLIADASLALDVPQEDLAKVAAGRTAMSIQRLYENRSDVTLIFFVSRDELGQLNRACRYQTLINLILAETDQPYTTFVAC